jgi:hypothetical protein
LSNPLTAWFSLLQAEIEADILAHARYRAAVSDCQSILIRRTIADRPHNYDTPSAWEAICADPPKLRTNLLPF